MLTSTIVYLAAAVICVPLAKALRLGSVLGYLAAGCIIGPFGLRVVSDAGATLHFAEIGVVLMLFVIGLELDMKHLWTLRRAVFGGGVMQLAAAAVPLGLGALALGLPWQAALVSGLSLGLSSTAVSMQIMGEKNLLPTPVGRTAFAILLFQDIAAIPLLGLVPFLAAAPGESAGLNLMEVLKVLGAVLLKGVSDVLLGDLPAGWEGPFVVGTLAALGSGLLAIEWLLGYVRRHTYGVFVAYRLLLAAIVLLVIAGGVRDATF